MILEHGFMNSPEGKEMYKQNLLQIAQCVQETANHDVVSAYLTCSNYDKEWERKHGIKQDGVRRMMTEEVNRTGCVQKTVYGLDILIEDVKKRLARYGAKPDMMVIPQKMAIYMTMVRPEKTQYYLGGKVTEENIRQGPDAMTTFRGLNVFETRSFDVYEGEPPIDLLLRARQHGEYYTVSDHSSNYTDSNWSMDNLSLQVYDEDSDNWRRLRLQTLIAGCVMIPPAKDSGNKYAGSDGMRVAGLFGTDSLANALKKAQSHVLVIDGDPTNPTTGGVDTDDYRHSRAANLTSERNRKQHNENNPLHAQDARKTDYWSEEITRDGYTSELGVYEGLAQQFGALQDQKKITHQGDSLSDIQQPDFSTIEECNAFGEKIQAHTDQSIGYHPYLLAGETGGNTYGVCFYGIDGNSISPPSAMYSCFFDFEQLKNDDALRHALIMKSTEKIPDDLKASKCVYRRAVTVAEIDVNFLTDEFLTKFVRRFRTQANKIIKITKDKGYVAKFTNQFPATADDPTVPDKELNDLTKEMNNDDRVSSVFISKILQLGNLLQETTEATSISMANGLARHPMHDCFLGNSYSGVSAIANVDKGTRGNKAREIVDLVDMVAGESNFLVAHVEEPTPNYSMSVDGRNYIKRSSREQLLISTFNRLMGGVGHTVAGVDESGNYMAPSLPGDMCIALPTHLSRLQSGGVTGSVLTNVSLGIGVGSPDLTQSIDQRDTDWHFQTEFSTNAILNMYKTLHVAGRNAGPGQDGSNAFVPNKRARTRVAASSDSIEGENPMVSMFLEHHVGARHEEKPNTGHRQFRTQRKGDEDGYINLRGFDAQKRDRADLVTNLEAGVKQMAIKPRSPNAALNVDRLARMVKEYYTDIGIVMLAGNTLASYMLTKEDMQMKTMQGYPFPFEFLVFRPFIEHQCYSLVITKGGGETGATYYGHNNVTLGDDAVSKLHYANLTFYQKSIIHNPKNVYIAEDVYFTGYLGGNSMDIFKSREDIEAGNTRRRAGQCRYEKSMFVMLMQENECSQLRNPVSITGSFPEHIDKFQQDRVNFCHGQQYSSAAHAYAKFGLQILEGGGQNSGLGNDVEPFEADVQRQNTICFQGAQWNYNDKVHDYNIEVKNTGHLGPTYAGVRPVREGQHKHMEIPNAPRAPAASAQAPVY
jgi:hypothetical protein